MVWLYELRRNKEGILAGKREKEGGIYVFAISGETKREKGGAPANETFRWVSEVGKERENEWGN